MEDSVSEERLRRIREHRHAPIEDVIAEQKLIAIVGDDRQEVVLQVGRPYVDSDGVARCPVASWGLDNRHPDIGGVETLQALNLACGLLERRLLDEIYSGRTKFILPECVEDDPISAQFVTMSLFGRTMVKRPRQRKSDAPSPVEQDIQDGTE